MNPLVYRWSIHGMVEERYLAHGPVGAFVSWERYAQKERARRDLLSGMFVNCVYCGHRYGPSESTPVDMAEVLKQHIAVCPDHPLSGALEALELAKRLFDEALPKFNWGASALDANAIRLLNEAPLAVVRAIATIKGVA